MIHTQVAKVVLEQNSMVKWATNSAGIPVKAQVSQEFVRSWQSEDFYDVKSTPQTKVGDTACAKV